MAEYDMTKLNNEEDKQEDKPSELIVRYFCPNNNCGWTVDVVCDNKLHGGQSIYYYTCPICKHTLKSTKIVREKQIKNNKR